MAIEGNLGNHTILAKQKLAEIKNHQPMNNTMNTVNIAKESPQNIELLDKEYPVARERYDNNDLGQVPGTGANKGLMDNQRVEGKVTQADEASEKSETEKVIDQAVLKVSENGWRSGFAPEEIMAETAGKVTKTQIKAWINKNLAAGRVKEFSRCLLILDTKGHLVDEYEELKEKQQEVELRMIKIEGLLAVYGEDHWTPA